MKEFSESCYTGVKDASLMKRAEDYPLTLFSRGTKGVETLPMKSKHM